MNKKEVEMINIKTLVSLMHGTKSGISQEITEAVPDKKSISELNQPSVLTIFFGVSYRIGFSPFKLETLNDGTIITKSSRIQKIVWIILAITTNVVRFTEVRKRLPQSQHDWNPLFYFQFLSGIVNIIFNISAAFTLLTKADNILNLVRFTTSNTDALPKPTEFVKKIVTWLLFSFCVGELLLGILISMMEMGIVSSLRSKWNFSKLVWCLVHEGKFAIFRNDHLPCSNGTTQAHPSDLLKIDYVIAIAVGIMKIFRHIHGYFGELLLATGVLSLWLPSLGFYKAVRETRGPFKGKFEALHGKYEALKHCAKLCNEVFNAMLFWFVIASIFYYSSNLDTLVITQNTFIRLRVFSFYVSAFVTFTLAADICHRVKALDEWLSELSPQDVNMIPQNNLMLLMHELSSYKVGMTGYNIITVTYGFVANMSGVLMTYFVVCVQFRSPWMIADSG